MKKLFLFVFLFSTTLSFSQNTLDGFSYQAVVRSADGLPLSEKEVNVYIDLFSKNQTAPLYSEEHLTKTDKFGQFSLIIGQGSIINGQLESLPWESGSIFYRVEISNIEEKLEVISEAQLLAVPYAFYAIKAGEIAVEDQPEGGGPNNPSKGSVWSTKGNEDADKHSDPPLLGTSDYNPIVFITNDIERLRITEDGDIIVVGNNTIEDDLVVKGNVLLNSVYGTTEINGAAQLNESLDVVGNTTLDSDLNVGGNTTLNGETTFKGALSLNHDLTVVGKTQLDSSLTVIDETVLQNTLTVDGATTLNSDLDVAGNTDINGNVDIDGTTQLNQTLDVVGNTTLDSDLNVGGNTTLEGETTFKGALSLNHDLTVVGKTQLDSSLTVIDETVLQNTLTVDGATTLNSDLDVSGNTTLEGTTTFNGTLALNDDLTVDGTTQLNQTLDVTGNTTLNSDLIVDGATDLSGSLDVDGVSTFNNDFNINGDFTSNGVAVLDSTVTIKGDLTTKSGKAVFNEKGEDYNFRVESMNKSKMILVDSDMDRVGVGLNGASIPATTLDINGDVQTKNGDVVFNEGGGDYNFRVESKKRKTYYS